MFIAKFVAELIKLVLESRVLRLHRLAVVAKDLVRLVDVLMSIF